MLLYFRKLHVPKKHNHFFKIGIILTISIALTG